MSLVSNHSDLDDLGLSPEFLADDSDARAEDEFNGPYGGGRCTCGFAAAMREAEEYDHRDYPEADLFPGCQGCDPVMHDSKPYGWGVERFEDPALAEANGYAGGLVILAGSMYRSPPQLADGDYRTSDTRREIRDQRWAANSTQSKRRLRHSDIVWGRICDEADGHSDAVRRYKVWANRAVTVRYRDEHAACPEPLCPACGEAPCEPLAGLCGACERENVLAHDVWQDAVAAEHYALIEAGLLDVANDFDPFR
jgi:hypothetical protein